MTVRDRLGCDLADRVGDAISTEEPAPNAGAGRRHARLGQRLYRLQTGSVLGSNLDHRSRGDVGSFSAHFHDENAAFGYLEATIWPTGPVCPHCGATGRIGAIKANKEKRVRHGLRVCRDCNKQFTAKVGTVF